MNFSPIYFLTTRLDLSLWSSLAPPQIAFSYMTVLTSTILHLNENDANLVNDGINEVLSHALLDPLVGNGQKSLVNVLAPPATLNSTIPFVTTVHKDGQIGEIPPEVEPFVEPFPAPFKVPSICVDGISNPMNIVRGAVTVLTTPPYSIMATQQPGEVNHVSASIKRVSALSTKEPTPTLCFAFPLAPRSEPGPLGMTAAITRPPGMAMAAVFNGRQTVVVTRPVVATSGPAAQKSIAQSYERALAHALGPLVDATVRLMRCAPIPPAAFAALLLAIGITRDSLTSEELTYVGPCLPPGWANPSGSPPAASPSSASSDAGTGGLVWTAAEALVAARNWREQDHGAAMPIVLHPNDIVRVSPTYLAPNGKRGQVPPATLSALALRLGTVVQHVDVDGTADESHTFANLISLSSVDGDMADPARMPVGPIGDPASERARWLADDAAEAAAAAAAASGEGAASMIVSRESPALPSAGDHTVLESGRGSRNTVACADVVFGPRVDLQPSASERRCIPPGVLTRLGIVSLSPTEASKAIVAALRAITCGIMGLMTPDGCPSPDQSPLFAPLSVLVGGGYVVKSVQAAVAGLEAAAPVAATAVDDAGVFINQHAATLVCVASGVASGLRVATPRWCSANEATLAAAADGLSRAAAAVAEAATAAVGVCWHLRFTSSEVTDVRAALHTDSRDGPALVAMAQQQIRDRAKGALAVVRASRAVALCLRTVAGAVLFALRSRTGSPAIAGVAAPASLIAQLKSSTLSLALSSEATAPERIASHAAVLATAAYDLVVDLTSMSKPVSLKSSISRIYSQLDALLGLVSGDPSAVPVTSSRYAIAGADTEAASSWTEERIVASLVSARGVRGVGSVWQRVAGAVIGALPLARCTLTWLPQAALGGAFGIVGAPADVLAAVIAVNVILAAARATPPMPPSDWAMGYIAVVVTEAGARAMAVDESICDSSHHSLVAAYPAVSMRWQVLSSPDAAAELGTAPLEAAKALAARDRVPHGLVHIMSPNMTELFGAAALLVEAAGPDDCALHHGAAATPRVQVAVPRSLLGNGKGLPLFCGHVHSYAEVAQMVVCDSDERRLLRCPTCHVVIPAATLPAACHHLLKSTVELVGSWLKEGGVDADLSDIIALIDDTVAESSSVVGNLLEYALAEMNATLSFPSTTHFPQSRRNDPSPSSDNLDALMVEP